MAMNSSQKLIWRTCCFLGVLTSGCWFIDIASAQMQSESFRVNSAVVSGGGTPPGGSTSFNLNGTMGQPTPLMDPDDPPLSTEYALSPGFWYTLGRVPVGCDDAEAFASAFGSVTGQGNYNATCDREGDGDVDGEDLALFAAIL